MVLSALAVIFIQTEASQSAGAAEMASYTVFKIDDSDGSSNAIENFEQSFLNALVIVCVIACMTFGIVLVYKFRCMMFLIGYMILSSCTLLGLLGGTMAYVAVEKFRIPIDWFSFVFLLANFAIVGATAIFFGKGIPMYITQAYLVATSIILAWQLSHFDPWTTWALLVMLALYDLCAVLTPCGPLKALVNLMSEEDAPEMPGLLYEAHLGEGIRRPGGSRTVPARQTTTQQPTSNPTDPNLNTQTSERMSGQIHPSSANHVPNTGPTSPDQMSTSDRSTTPRAPESTVESINPVRQEVDTNNDNVGFVPLAIARLYKLPVVSETTQGRQTPPPGLVSTSPLLGETGATNAPPTPQELKAEVEVRFPPNGGRIVRQTSSRSGFEPRYFVYGRDGELRRVLILDPQGRVFQESDDDDDDSNSTGSAEDGPASIRLGLGDFIFYSVLVAQAAAYGFTTFISCTLVILAGLGGTLVLLSVYHKALPALPISIFLGVATYLLTRAVVQPWIFDLLTKPYYV